MVFAAVAAFSDSVLVRSRVPIITCPRRAVSTTAAAGISTRISTSGGTRSLAGGVTSCASALSSSSVGSCVFKARAMSASIGTYGAVVPCRKLASALWKCFDPCEPDETAACALTKLPHSLARAPEHHGERTFSPMSAESCGQYRFRFFSALRQGTRLLDRGSFRHCSSASSDASSHSTSAFIGDSFSEAAAHSGDARICCADKGGLGGWCNVPARKPSCISAFWLTRRRVGGTAALETRRHVTRLGSFGSTAKASSSLAGLALGSTLGRLKPLADGLTPDVWTASRSAVGWKNKRCLINTGIPEPPITAVVLISYVNPCGTAADRSNHWRLYTTRWGRRRPRPPRTIYSVAAGPVASVSLTFQFRVREPPWPPATRWCEEARKRFEPTTWSCSSGRGVGACRPFPGLGAGTHDRRASSFAPPSSHTAAPLPRSRYPRRSALLAAGACRTGACRALEEIPRFQPRRHARAPQMADRWPGGGGSSRQMKA
eukprot:scaffold43208_cov74-Phaeocystis_antarctica.AAC.11